MHLTLITITQKKRKNVFIEREKKWRWQVKLYNLSKYAQDSDLEKKINLTNCRWVICLVQFN